MDKLLNEAKQIIQENIYGTLGTSGNTDSPWVTPLFISYDTELNFYFLSPKSSRHSTNVRENQKTSLVIFDSTAPKWTGKGVYAEGITLELDDRNEIEKGLKLEHERLKEPTPSLEEFTGENEYRVYKFVPSRFWVTNDIKDDHGSTIDYRTELSRESLVKLFAS